jgi:hypothetical protein
MPLKWQVKFVELLDELDKQMDWRPDNKDYYVQMRGDNGRFYSVADFDPFADYERGRRVIPNRKGKIIKDFME